MKHHSTRWSREVILMGLCGSCGQPLGRYSSLCDACAKKQRERMRERLKIAPERFKVKDE